MPSLRAILQQAFPQSAPLVSSAFWLSADRAFRLGIGLVVGLVVTRYLGPAASGLLQAGLALAAILGAVIELGLENVLRRELVRNPQNSPALLGTSVCLRLAALGPALVAFILIFGWQTAGTNQVLGAWLAVTIAMPLLQTLDTWLLASGRMRASAVAGSTALGVSTILRLGLIALGATVVAFAAVMAIEVLLTGLALGLAFWFSAHPPGKWRWDRATARELLRGAAPLLLTNVAILIYRRCDLLMVAAQLDNRAAGIYAAAVRLSELGYLPPMILINAWFPRLTQLHAGDRAQYESEMARFFRIVTWLGVAFATAASLSAPWLVRGLFGPAFADAAVPFAIHAWTGVFVAQGIVRSQWLLLEDKLTAGLLLAVAGAVINLALNALLIPQLGYSGAALAAVLALALNLVGFTAISRRTRPAWVLGWRALFVRPPGQN